jgi:small-conductance mechanosensitive channel
MEMTVEQETYDNPSTYGAMLAIIRRRRWCLWGLILIYIPATVTTLQLTQSFKMTGIVFFIWFILLCIVATLIACSKCPRCGNNFHMRNATLSLFRKCRHCGLHILGDKKAVS